MWQSSNTIRAGHMPHIALCCLEGSTLSNLVHRRRRCARIVSYMILCLEGSTPQDGCLSMFIALRWMQRPERVMVGLAENIQACLRIFRRAQHQMARKRHLASSARGLLCFCLMAHRTNAAHSTLLPGGQYARGQVFIFVYRLAIDAEPKRGDGGDG